jgi:hypothetical protein
MSVPGLSEWGRYFLEHLTLETQTSPGDTAPACP